MAVGRRAWSPLAFGIVDGVSRLERNTVFALCWWVTRLDGYGIAFGMDADVSRLARNTLCDRWS